MGNATLSRMAGHSLAAPRARKEGRAMFNYNDIRVHTPKPCTCWVRGCSEIERFGIRRGAHSTTCPIYRPSRDPADATSDKHVRAHGEYWAAPRA